MKTTSRLWIVLVLLSALGAMSAALAQDFVYIEPGTFYMGSPTNEPGRYSDRETQHAVTISHGFYISKYEVTESWWHDVMGSGSISQIPKGLVSWDMAVQFCNTLSIQEGLTPAYTINGTNGNVTWDRNANGYRLPTEAEWEYACRSGTTLAYNNNTNCLSSDDEANFRGSSSQLPSCPAGIYRTYRIAVGSFPPNAWGVYDLHGNVTEWVWDGYRADYQNLPETDPAYDVGSGVLRVLRGGAFNYFARDVRSASRYGHAPNLQGANGPDFGFRVARSGSGPDVPTIAIENMGGAAWGGKITWSGDGSESVSVYINDVDVTNYCYFSHNATWLSLPTIIAKRNNEEIRVRAIVESPVTPRTENVVVFDTDDYLIGFYDRVLDNIGIQIMSDILTAFNGGEPAELDMLLMVGSSFEQFAEGDVAEGLVDLLNSAFLLTPEGTVDCIVEEFAFGYVAETRPLGMSAEEFEDFQNDVVPVKVVKILVYFSGEMELYVNSVTDGSPFVFYNPFSQGSQNIDWLSFAIFQDFIDALDDLQQAIIDLIDNLFVFSPIDVLVVDAAGDTLSVDVNTIANSRYIERSNPPAGEWEDWCLIYKHESGLISIYPLVEENALPGETYTITHSSGVDTLVVAVDVPIEEIPPQGYVVEIDSELTTVEDSIEAGNVPEVSREDLLIYLRPNPFNPTTTIVFELPQAERVSLSVYDMTGHLVRVLVDEVRVAGIHEVQWNGANDRGQQMASGVYFCRMEAGAFKESRRMTLVK